MLLSLLTACAGPGEHLPISLANQEITSSPFEATRGKVIVFPLRDARPEPKRLGHRVHLFGTIDTLEPAFSVGERVAQLLVSSLRQRGYDAQMASAGTSPEEVTEGKVVTGTIQTLRVDATSHLGYTQIEADSIVNIEIRDPKTGVKTDFKIVDENSPKVVFFRPEVLEETLRDLISDGMKRVLP